MRTEVFRMKEYTTHVRAWWFKWNGNAIHERLLSRYGVAVLEGETPLAVGYLFPTNTADFVYMGWVVRDPHMSGYKAGKALKLLIEAAEAETKRLGYSFLYTSFDSSALQKLMARRGYHPGSVVKEFFKEL